MVHIGASQGLLCMFALLFPSSFLSPGDLLNHLPKKTLACAMAPTVMTGAAGIVS